MILIGYSTIWHQWVQCNVSNVLSPPNVLKVEWTLTAVSCLMYHCCVYKYSEKNQIASWSRLLHICTWTHLPRACWGSTYGWCSTLSRSSSEQDTKSYRYASWRVCITFSLRLQRTKVNISAASQDEHHFTAEWAELWSLFFYCFTFQHRLFLLPAVE